MGQAECQPESFYCYAPFNCSLTTNVWFVETSLDLRRILQEVKVNSEVISLPQEKSHQVVKGNNYLNITEIDCYQILQIPE